MTDSDKKNVLFTVAYHRNHVNRMLAWIPWGLDILL